MSLTRHQCVTDSESLTHSRVFTWLGMLINVFVDVSVDICVYEYCVLNIGVNVSLDIGMDFGIDDADSLKALCRVANVVAVA